MINISKEEAGLKIELKAIYMGEDLNVLITGGDRPHIGAVALGVPVKDNNPDVSHLLLNGHKENDLVISAAKQLAHNLDVSVVVACGIHKDNIKKEEILHFVKMVEEGIQELIQLIKKENEDLL